MAIAVPNASGKTIAHIEILPLGEAAEKEPETLVDHLIESSSYEYRVREKGFRLREFPKIISRTKLAVSEEDRGTIKTGLYVGVLPLILESTDSIYIGTANVEVRSKKLQFETEFRSMLEDIANWSIDLATDFRSGVSGYRAPDASESWESLQQRYFLLSGILGSTTFSVAIQRILAFPDSQMEFREESTDARKKLRWNRSIARQFASSSNRTELPLAHPVRSELGLGSIPNRLNSNTKIDSFDTPANRFVKFALLSFEEFLSDLHVKLAALSEKKKRHKKADPRDSLLLEEIRGLRDKLGEFLSQALFKETNTLTHVHAGNPVLQRKAGYRELLLSWLQFQLGSHLEWEGSSDAYLAGQKNVAALYEYWCFFCLLRVFNTVCAETDLEDSIFELTADGLGLKIKAGRTLGPITGRIDRGGSSFCALFYYNKSFTHTASWDEEGSWSRELRPDYSLEIWPRSIDKECAEKNQLIVRLHFDAKYRVKFGEMFRKSSEQAEEEPNEDVIKRDYSADSLTKMHAYRDAIRRSEGAYVLYPGDKHAQFRGLDEVIPGVGVFPLRPDSADNGSAMLISFIEQILAHLEDRESARSRMAHRVWEVLRSPSHAPNNLPLPLTETGSDGSVRRTKPLSEISVLSLRNMPQPTLDWVLASNKLPLSLSVVNDIAGQPAKFLQTDTVLILREGDEPIEFSISTGSVELGESLVAAGYPEAAEERSIFCVLNLAPRGSGSTYFEGNSDVVPRQEEDLFWGMVTEMRT